MYHHVSPVPVDGLFILRTLVDGVRRLLAFCILVGNNQTPHVYGMYYVQLPVHG